MPIALRGPRKAMREKCECGRGKCERGLAFSTPWPRFHGVDRADVYIIIRVRACCCGECALNSPTSQPIPSRRPSLAPAQRHALAEHFRSPTQPRRTPAGCATHSPPTSPPIPRRRPPLAPAQRHALPEHFRSPTQCRRPPTQSRRTPAGCAMHARRPHNPLPAEDLRSPPQPRRTPAGCAMHARRPHHPFPAEDLRSLPHSDTPSPSTSAPHAAPTHAHAVPNRARRLREAFPAATRCLSFRSASGTKKTAPHSACAMPNVSVDRRCGRSFGLVSRALFAAVAGRWRVGVGLRPQPWALRSRRCGRVLRA